MSRRLPFAVLVLSAGACLSAMAADPAPGQVMMLGVFHFANPGRDVVKSEVMDVTTAGNQAYLEGLAKRLATFRPTDVLVECLPSAQGRQDEAYAAWRAGAALGVNETQQIGFRVAQQAGLEGVTCFDEGDVHWNGKPLFDHLAAHAPERKAQLDAMFAAISARTTQEQTTRSLPALLRLTNDPERDRENKDFYIGTNAVDAGAGFIGADASASWWHRNFRMYANVQKAAAPGRRVLVMAGYGHTAILKDLLAIDGQREAVDVVPYLAP
ncbi:MAG: DUF5694 domain-containing protein [Luteimonas sp.]